MAAKKKSSEDKNVFTYALKAGRQPTGRGGAGSQPGARVGSSTGRGSRGSANTAKPEQPTGRGARTGNTPYKAKWQTTDPGFPGWKMLPMADTTPKGRGKVVPPQSGGRPVSPKKTGKK